MTQPVVKEEPCDDAAGRHGDELEVRAISSQLESTMQESAVAAMGTERAPVQLNTYTRTAAVGDIVFSDDSIAVFSMRIFV